MVSTGHIGLTPSHTSSGSQRSPEPALHSVPDGSTSSAGHVPLLHVSVTSHVPAAARHGDPSGSAARQLSAISSHDSLQSVSPSGPVQGSPVELPHAPPVHVSVPLQNRPSVHAEPSG